MTRVAVSVSTRDEPPMTDAQIAALKQCNGIIPMASSTSTIVLESVPHPR